MAGIADGALTGAVAAGVLAAAMVAGLALSLSGRATDVAIGANDGRVSCATIDDGGAGVGVRPELA